MPEQINFPNSLNLDSHPKALKQNEAYYLLNHEVNREGFLGMSTPLTGNYPFGELTQPLGENYRVGSHKSEITNEVYAFIYNTFGLHYIQRVSDAKGLEVVYQNFSDSTCLKLSAEPKHAIEDWRVTMRIENVYNVADNVGCKNRHGKYLVWTDGLNTIGYLDVEASIATNSFSTPFFNVCANDCALLSLCVPEPCDILVGEYVPRGTSDNGLSNKIVDIGFKFIYRYIYYDERQSEWSTPSSMYYQTKDGCFVDNDNKPRCIKLRIPIGNPMVERIEVAFNKGDISTVDNSNIYLSYEIIDKYKKYNNSQQYWYERQLSEVLTSNGYSDTDCSFDYFFCNDKNCNPVSNPRTYNPMPIQPQGLIKVKDSLGFYNYIQGNCPIDKFQIDKFSIAADCSSNSCDSDLATVKVRLVIIDVRQNSNQFVYRMGGSYGGSDDIDDKAHYGAVFIAGASLASPLEIINGWGQEFTGARNFVAYIEGTQYYSEMKQYSARNGFTNIKEVGVISGQSSILRTSRFPPTEATYGGYYFQEAEFKVPKGTRGLIRVKSPNTGSNTDDTSAPVKATLQLNTFISNGAGGTNNTSITDGIYKYEIAFDTCNGDQDLREAFVVESVNGYNAGSDPEYFYSGYVLDENNKPVSGCMLFRASDRKCETDHNGYFSFYDNVYATMPIFFKLEQDCTSDFLTANTITLTGTQSTASDAIYKVGGQDYIDKFYETVNVIVLDCNNNPVGGVVVAMTEAKAQVSDEGTGLATFKVRNKRTRNKTVTGYVMDKNGCFSNNCLGGCNPCLPITAPTLLSACFQTNPTITLSTSERLNVAAIKPLGKSLKRGGRYPFGFVVKGNCGRISAVNELAYLDIPKAQASGNSDYCSLTYSVQAGFILPDWATCLEIVRGENINNYELQWVVDKFEKTSDNKIKITLQSLVDYNILYGAKTNTKYQWLSGDRVEFIKDQDGEILPAAQYGILNYLTISPFNDVALSGVALADNANFFNQILIEDDGKIDFLKAGSVIELQRSAECTTEPVYFSIGVSIPVDNGILVYPTGIFNTFDTYQTKRNIDNGALITFEHHSPSDFWGDRLTDVGKAYFLNRFENERRFTQSITLNSTSQYNYFGDIVKTFDGLSSDIISMNISDGKIVMIICQTDNALASAADDLIRMGNDGVIRAASPDAIISDGEPKLAGEYGCAYDDIGSIFYGDSFATWVDNRYYSYIKNDYRIAVSVDDNKAKTYFRTTGVMKNNFNKTASNPLDKFRYSSGLNFQTKALHITIKSLRQSGINNDSDPYISTNSTLMFNYESNDFLGFASFTPEGYSHLNLHDGFGCAMIVYQNGKPYIHPVIPANYNEFFGVSCDRYVGIAINTDPTKIKVPISFELQSDSMYYVSKVETSNLDFESEIPPIKIKETENKWNASFLKNKNSRLGLYGGEQARDYFIKVLFKRDDTDELKYATVDNKKRIKFDILSMILFVFILSERSGPNELQR